MRALVGLGTLVGLGACAAPTGQPQTWPPALGITVMAAALGDLDGDGVLDLAIAATGGVAGEGLYLVRGDRDWDGAAIATFTRFQPHSLAAIGALIDVPDTGLYLAYNVKGTATLEAIDPEALTTIATARLGIASKVRLALAAVAFPDLRPHVVIVGDDAVVQEPLGLDADVAALPPPMPPRWLQPQVAVGFGDASIAVVTPTQIFEAALDQPALAYTPVRPVIDTAALTAQIAATLRDATGANVHAIVGVDVATSKLCAIELAKTTGAACVAVPLVTGAKLSLVATEADEIAIVQADPAADTATVTTYARVVLDGTKLTTDGPLGDATGAHLALRAPRVIAVPQTAARPAHLFALGVDGRTACIGACPSP